MKSITFLTANIAVLRCLECNGVSPFIRSNFFDFKESPRKTYGALYSDGQWAKLDETTQWEEADL